MSSRRDALLGTLGIAEAASVTTWLSEALLASMFDTLKAELQLAMKFAGCSSIKDITRRFVP
jgi:hypothetical protein